MAAEYSAIPVQSIAVDENVIFRFKIINSAVNKFEKPCFCRRSSSQHSAIRYFFRLEKFVYRVSHTVSDVVEFYISAL